MVANIPHCAANTCSLCECTLPLNAVTPFGISSPAVHEGTISRPQQGAKFQYASTISTHLITRVNKREVDQYNCPLIGGGEIGLVKEIQLVGNIRTHVLSPKTGRSTTTRDRWLVASQPQSIVTQKLDEVFVHANNPPRSAI